MNTRHPRVPDEQQVEGGDRKSTRLNSSHDQISYAVFCLKKKKKKKIQLIHQTYELTKRSDHRILITLENNPLLVMLTIMWSAYNTRICRFTCMTYSMHHRSYD